MPGSFSSRTPSWYDGDASAILAPGSNTIQYGMAKKNPKGVGDASEAAILAHLLKHGCAVSIPFGQSQRYDLVVEHRGKLLRAQCKTGRLVEGRLIRVAFYSVDWLTHESKGYKGQVDVFLVFCPENEKVYMIPAERVGLAMTLRVGQNFLPGGPRAHRASDYEFKP